jgi:hypothetical protein
MASSSKTMKERGIMMHSRTRCWQNALLDRLLHHVEVIPINGRSYRMKERQVDRTGLSTSSEVALSSTGGKSTGVR